MSSPCLYCDTNVSVLFEILAHFMFFLAVCYCRLIDYEAPGQASNFSLQIMLTDLRTQPAPASTVFTLPGVLLKNNVPPRVRSPSVVNILEDHLIGRAHPVLTLDVVERDGNPLYFGLQRGNTVREGVFDSI
jgi:hypothetical protein